MSRRAVTLVAALLVAGAVVAVIATRGGDDARRAGRAAPSRVRPVEGDHLQVTRVVADPIDVVVGRPVQLAADVEHGTAASGALHYTWSVPGGALADIDAEEVVWTAPGKPGRKKVKVTVTDGTRTATGTVTIEVRLPSPREVAELGDLMKQQTDKRDAELAQLVAAELRVAELAAVAEKKDTIADLLRAQEALEEMARLYADLGRFEDARAVYDRLLANMLPGASKHGGYSASLGDALFMVGDEDGALAAWNAAGDHAQGMSLYYKGELLERRGDRDGALEAYAAAADGARRFGDVVYRQALLLLESGADPEAVATMLVDASAHLDRDRMLARFASDPETAPLGRLLDVTGRVADLEEQRPMIIDEELPTGGTR